MEPLEPQVVNKYYTNTIEHHHYYSNTVENYYTNTITYISNYYFTNNLPFEYLVMTGYITPSNYFNYFSFHTVVFSNSNITPQSIAELYVSDDNLTYVKVVEIAQAYLHHRLYSESNRIRLLDRRDLYVRTYEDMYYTLHVLIPGDI